MPVLPIRVAGGLGKGNGASPFRRSSQHRTRFCPQMTQSDADGVGILTTEDTENAEGEYDQYKNRRLERSIFSWVWFVSWFPLPYPFLVGRHRRPAGSAMNSA